MRARVDALRAAGLQVVLGPGINDAPAWAVQSEGSTYVDQYGVSASGVPNVTFSQRLRSLAAKYIHRLLTDFGVSTFWAIRVGSGADVEVLYPTAWDSAGHTNAYWAYDPNAQSGSDRPSSIPAPPMPGWKPGEREYQGKPVSTDQVQAWYEWYVGAMVDGVNWQIATFKATGFTGPLQVLMPGLGTRPSEYRDAISDYLGGRGDASHTLGRGAMWNVVIDGLTDRAKVVAYISSVADGSGNDDGCQADDSTISLDDPTINNWSATRWISFNANRYGMDKGGENPGRHDQAQRYGQSMLAGAMRQVKACGLSTFLWAHDGDLYAPSSGISLDEYARAIAGPLAVPTE
jgi:hypothetical protein